MKGNHIKTLIDDFEIYLIYSLRSPGAEYSPEKISTNGDKIIAHTTWSYSDIASTLFPNRMNPKGKFKGSISWVLAATMGTVLDIMEEFPEMIEIHPRPIKMYKNRGYKISKLLRNLLLRINPF
ncbi:MAG: hypothetical protein HWN66_00840 [Candidatus Helarchaeota archaeon]|nr:hypothetical protein [Candidatus Helarchaeota archaeon]